MKKSLAKVNSFEWSDKEIETIKSTVAKGASDTELSMFLHISQTYGLDPFLKEIWFINMKGAPVIFTSRDGYLKIAHRNEAFDGIISDVVYEGDIFKRIGLEVHHEYSSKRGAIIGAYAIVYRSDKKVPTYAWAPFKDYNQNNTQWNKYPHAMILKVAEALTLKRAFSISGMVTKEELDMENLESKEIPQKQPLNEPKKAIEGTKDKEVVEATFVERPKNARNGLKITIWNKFIEHYKSQDVAIAAAKKVVNDKASGEWDDKDIEALNDHINSMNSGVLFDEADAYGCNNEDFKRIGE